MDCTIRKDVPMTQEDIYKIVFVLFMSFIGAFFPSHLAWLVRVVG